jgi:hypothetical protein
MKKNLILESQKFHLRIGHFSGICILTLLAVFIIISCTKKDTILQDDLLVVNDITFRDGRLIFKDDSTFKNHQQWLFENQKNTQLIVEKNKSLGLKSMTEYYLEGMKLDEADPKFSEYVSKYPSVFYKEPCDSSTLYLLPHSKILCYVANKDGIFQVGDQIYRIAENYIYQTADESKIEMLFLPKNQISNKDVKISLSRPSIEKKNDYGNKTEWFSNDNRFRIVSSLREYVMGVSWYYDIFTNPQKRNWTGIYFRAQLNTRAANGNGHYAYQVGGTNYPLYAYVDEQTGASQDVYYLGADPINLSASYVPAYSRGRLIDGTVEFIYIEWGNALSNPPSYTVTHTDVESNPF